MFVDISQFFILEPFDHFHDHFMKVTVEKESRDMISLKLFTPCFENELGKNERNYIKGKYANNLPVSLQ